MKRRLLAARAMSDVAAAQTAIVVQLADSLGIFTAIGKSMTADAVAAACNIEPARAAAILATLAASGYADFDPSTNAYSLSDEQRAIFADETDPLFLGGAFELAVGLARSDDAQIARGISRSSRAKFPPLIERVAGERLAHAQSVVELGCGDGTTLLALAERYPHLRATGIDPRTRAASNERVTFIRGDESALPPCDVVLSLEMLHEASDPLAVARAVHAALREGGSWLIVEPCAARDGGGNDARFLASLAALYCLPSSGYALGALGPLAPRGAYERVVREAGFNDVRIEDEGAIHIIVDARR